MKKYRHTAEQIITTPRQIEVEAAGDQGDRPNSS